MINTFSRLQSKLTGFQLAAITLVALMGNVWATRLLDTAYAASRFPVPYWQAQLSFDHLKLKGWYEFLIKHQTFDLYIHTQLVDFIFIVSVLILHTAALLALSRAVPASSNARRALIWAALISAIAPLADAVENGISFIMLANPAGFEPILAMAYSCAAAIKFGMFTFAYLAAAGGLLAGLYYLATRIWKEAIEAQAPSPWVTQRANDGSPRLLNFISSRQRPAHQHPLARAVRPRKRGKRASGPFFKAASQVEFVSSAVEAADK